MTRRGAWRVAGALAFGVTTMSAVGAGLASTSTPTPTAEVVDAAAASPVVDRTVELSGGRRIAIHCAGRGADTVLLETGDGGHRRHMAALFDVLATRHRVCAYDRRNVGGSSSAPLPRRAADLAADAFDALDSVGVDGPVIVFGTSMGGLLARAYAAMHQVAGFVTSNQPGTTREWMPRAHRHMSAEERAADLAWMAGDNLEHIDVNDVSRAIDEAPTPIVPHIVMISTERRQCPAAGACGAMYRAFVAASREAAAGPHGRLRVLDGDHDLYVTDLAAVVSAIDAVAAEASSGAGRAGPPVSASTGRHTPSR